MLRTQSDCSGSEISEEQKQYGLHRWRRHGINLSVVQRIHQQLQTNVKFKSNIALHLQTDVQHQKPEFHGSVFVRNNQKVGLRCRAAVYTGTNQDEWSCFQRCRLVREFRRPTNREKLQDVVQIGHQYSNRKEPNQQSKTWPYLRANTQNKSLIEEHIQKWRQKWRYFRKIDQ